VEISTQSESELSTDYSMQSSFSGISLASTTPNKRLSLPSLPEITEEIDHQKAKDDVEKETHVNDHEDDDDDDDGDDDFNDYAHHEVDGEEDMEIDYGSSQPPSAETNSDHKEVISNKSLTSSEKKKIKNTPSRRKSFEPSGRGFMSNEKSPFIVDAGENPITPLSNGKLLFCFIQIFY
jgi:hypothetical protein